MGALVLVREKEVSYEVSEIPQRARHFNQNLGRQSDRHRSEQSNQHRGQQTEMDLETLFLNGQLENALARLTDDELLSLTESAVETERRQGLIVVKHFNEIYKRQLFLARGYPSMFEMLRKRYLYCAGSAQLRISSMKLMSEVPEVEAKLETGELSMSAAAQLQTFFRA
ncbi:MAG: hypothetical protein EON58_15545, partial [Alphaproteobacteria bacterium]